MLLTSTNFELDSEDSKDKKDFLNYVENVLKRHVEVNGIFFSYLRIACKFSNSAENYDKFYFIGGIFNRLYSKFVEDRSDHSVLEKFNTRDFNDIDLYIGANKIDKTFFNALNTRLNNTFEDSGFKVLSATKNAITMSYIDNVDIITNDSEKFIYQVIKPNDDSPTGSVQDKMKTFDYWHTMALATFDMSKDTIDVWIPNITFFCIKHKIIHPTGNVPLSDLSEKRFERLRELGMRPSKYMIDNIGIAFSNKEMQKGNGNS